MTPLALETHAVSHAYGDRVALREVSLSIERGQLIGLLGPNGSGKTTLFRVISTLLRPTSGNAKVFGHDTVSDPDEARRRLGVVFQTPALDDELTIRENVYTSAALYGMSGAALVRRFESLAEVFDLTDRTEQRVNTLSGGLKRRADLLRGLLHSPGLLLLDEPTSGLDPIARRAFWDTLSRLRRSEGTTMLVATHLMEEAEQCDQIAIVDEGRILEMDEPAALRDRLGGDSIWLETDKAVILRDHILTRFGVEGRIVGNLLQVSDETVFELLPRLHEAFGDLIEAATIRKPTLEDVFISLTGRRISDGLDESDAVSVGMITTSDQA